MIKAPNMLLVGAAMRNAGKTEFACSLLRRFVPQQPIIAVKITVIREEGGACPRGGQGCGACYSLEGNYDIFKETDYEGPKDTSRLLRAGADRVYWMRVLASHMEEGLAALRHHIPPEAPFICESNSIRNAVEPGLFFMVQDENSPEYKPTAQAVAGLADRTVLSDGKSFNIAPESISLGETGWQLREPATAIILAGGASSRMGRDKSQLEIGGRPLIAHVCDQLKDHFNELIISINNDSCNFLGYRTVPDRIPDQGPLMGLASCLDVAANDVAFAVACDIPHIDMHLAHRMLNQAPGYDAVVPRVLQPEGLASPHLEPLHAVYRSHAASQMFKLLEQGERRMRSFFQASHIHYIDLEPDAAPENLNTEHDYRAYIARTGERQTCRQNPQPTTQS